MTGYKPKKWPSYALWALEDSIALTTSIETTTRRAQEDVLHGDNLAAMLLLSDIRSQSQRIREALVRAKSGDYERG